MGSGRLTSSTFKTAREEYVEICRDRHRRKLGYREGYGTSVCSRLRSIALAARSGEKLGEVGQQVKAIGAEPQSLLVANPINRYLVNSPMLPQLQKDADGGLTLIVQNQSPGKDKEANWLPAPKGPFSVIMRLYWPKEAALDGKWTAAPLRPAT